MRQSNVELMWLPDISNLIIMFLAALLTGSLATQLKNHAKQSAQAAYRTKVLFDTNQILQQEKNQEDIISATSRQLVKLLGRGIVFYPVENGLLGEARTFSPDGNVLDNSCLSVNEKGVAKWVLKNNKHAGATTDTLSDA